jgi:hypothetical protein
MATLSRGLPTEKSSKGRIQDRPGAIRVLEDLPTTAIRGKQSLFSDYISQEVLLILVGPNDHDGPTSACGGVSSGSGLSHWALEAGVQITAGWSGPDVFDTPRGEEVPTADRGNWPGEHTGRSQSTSSITVLTYQVLFSSTWRDALAVSSLARRTLSMAD